MTNQQVSIRNAAPSDLARLHSINQASTPGVGAVSQTALAALNDIAALTVMAKPSASFSA